MPKRSPAGCLPGRDRFSIDDPAERVGDTRIKNDPDPCIRARLFFLQQDQEQVFLKNAQERTEEGKAERNRRHGFSLPPEDILAIRRFSLSVYLMQMKSVPVFLA